MKAIMMLMFCKKSKGFLFKKAMWTFLEDVANSQSSYFNLRTHGFADISNKFVITYFCNFKQLQGEGS